MMRRAIALTFLLAGCTDAAPAARPASDRSGAAAVAPSAAPPVATPGAAATVSAPAEAGRRAFGAPLDPAVPEVALADVVAHPDQYRDALVRTRGTVVRVCQRMGCWMEMSAEGTPAVRVPMAGHAFFLPRDAEGRPTEVQGRVRLLELTADARAHLASEGATAVSSALAIDASGVALD